MSDLISRSVLLEALVYCDGLGRKSCEAVIKTINEQPTVEAKPVVRGEWKHRKKWDRYVCSVCSHESKTNDNFCPNCGADMRKKVE